ncbi:MAG: HsdM family class I SAM-dependent methyltransferase, partial [Candidatus Methylumidiphilus sp.]
PVGLLSQVYEAFCWESEPDDSKSTSVHYTPRNIAAVLIDEAFDGIADAHECRVLDPACGAAVFLVLAFRRLYREHWQSTGIRPDTQAIRAILENQLVGFDISDSALRLAALSLYLTAIELDPKPVPPEKLRFRSLKDKVLFNHRRPGIDPDSGPVIGSLGEHVGDRFDGQFDIVLSNPPWTSLKELKDTKRKNKLTAAFTNLSKAIIHRKGKVDLSENYQNPDSTPDLPFLWKSTEWCKPGGRIAMALPTRILFKLQDIPRLAREIIFRIIEVNGIINGSNLADTNVWPNMRQPFMLLFARNQPPSQGHHLQFITPCCDTKLNSKGELRIDSKSAKPIEVEATFEQPWLWKALAIGTFLDVDVIQQINTANGRHLKDYWEKDLKLITCNGYKKEGKQTPADDLKDLLCLDSTRDFRFIVNYENLSPLFNNPTQEVTLSRPRKREIYNAPLVLVLESPGQTRANGRALLAFEDVAFNESFYGYSAAKHPQGKTLVRYLHLFIHSHIWMHYALMITPQFGAERRTVDKAVVDECPIIPFESLDDTQRKQIEVLSERLINSTKQDSEVFDEIDLFFANLYGLDGLDLEVIRDTLEVCLPYDESRKRAYDPPNGAEQEIFQQRVEAVLRPFFTIVGEEPEITLWKPKNNFRQNECPFGMILITKRGQSIEKPDEIFHQLILRLADDTGTTRIIHTVEGGLVIGILNQYRYWTLSRARLLGAEIVRQHLSVFED